MKTKIKHAWILTMDEEMHEYEDGELVFEDDQILYVGPQSSIEADHEIDAQHNLVLPGMVNTHCHAAMIPFRSLGDDCVDRLRRFLFPLELECMNEKLTYLSMKYGVAEMLLSGITCVADMYYFIEQMAQACQDMGIRALLGETIYEGPTCDSEKAYGGLDRGRSFMEKWKDHPLITPTLAPHATNTNEAHVFQKAMEIVKQYDTLLMSHVAEMDYEMTYFDEKYQMTPVEWLSSIGCLNDHMLLVHCIHTNETDLDLIKQSQASIAHCISANMKAGKGIAPLKQMCQKEIAVGLGTDGPSSGNTLELFSSMRLVAMSQKTKYHDRSLFPAKDIVKLATIGGAKALHMDHKIGSLEAKKQADIIIVDTHSVNMFPIFDPYSALVYSASSHDVTDVFIAGKQLVKDKKLTIDLHNLKEDLFKEMSQFKKSALKRAKDI